MSLLKAGDSKKWIAALLVALAAIVSILMIKFITFLGGRFELEARIDNFELIAQGVGVLSGLFTFIFCIKKQSVVKYLDEVFTEMLKVIWPDKESSVKVTILVVIGVSIVSALLVLGDLLFKKVLEFFY